VTALDPGEAKDIPELFPEESLIGGRCALQRSVADSATFWATASARSGRCGPERAFWRESRKRSHRGSADRYRSWILRRAGVSRIGTLLHPHENLLRHGA